MDFVLLAINGSCIPGDGSICAVRTTLAPLGSSTASVSATYGTACFSFALAFSFSFSLAESDRPELARRCLCVGVRGVGGEPPEDWNGPKSSSTLSRSSRSCSFADFGEAWRSLRDAEACRAWEERVRVRVWPLGGLVVPFARRATFVVLTSSISCSQSKSSLTLDGVRPPLRLQPPAIGEHTRELLRAAGYAEAQIEAMLAAGAAAAS